MFDRLRLRRAQRGDRRALDAILRDLLPQVRRTLYRMASSESELDDLCQEALVQIASSLPSFRGESELSSWAHRVSIRSAWKFLRARNNVILIFPTEANEVGPDGPERMEARAALGQLQRQLLKLPAAQRVVFVLRDVQGMTAVETADVLEIPVGTVHTRLRSARSKLAETWRPEASVRDARASSLSTRGGEF